MRRFTRFIGSLPLAGKLLIRPLAFDLYYGLSASVRRRNYLKLLAVVSVFSLCHTDQARLGMNLALASVPAWVVVIGTLYACINVAVILTQLHILFRATRFLHNGPYARKARYCRRFSDREFWTIVWFTLGGQMAFLLVWGFYST